jgi:predicted Na+-dependent transporter
MKLFIAVLLPTILAVICYELRPSETLKPSMGVIAKVGMLYMIILNTSVAALNTPLSMKVLFVLGIMALQVSLFYATGALAGRLLSISSESKITLTYYLGMKNNGAALVMALAGFPPQSTLPVALAIACQQPMASIIDRLWRRFHER